MNKFDFINIQWTFTHVATIKSYLYKVNITIGSKYLDISGPVSKINLQNVHISERPKNPHNVLTLKIKLLRETAFKWPKSSCEVLEYISNSTWDWWTFKLLWPFKIKHSKRVPILMEHHRYESKLNLMLYHLVGVWDPFLFQRHAGDLRPMPKTSSIISSLLLIQRCQWLLHHHHQWQGISSQRKQVK